MTSLENKTKIKTEKCELRVGGFSWVDNLVETVMDETYTEELKEQGFYIIKRVAGGKGENGSLYLHYKNGVSILILYGEKSEGLLSITGTEKSINGAKKALMSFVKKDVSRISLDSPE